MMRSAYKRVYVGLTERRYIDRAEVWGRAERSSLGQRIDCTTPWFQTRRIIGRGESLPETRTRTLPHVMRVADVSWYTGEAEFFRLSICPATRMWQVPKFAKRRATEQEQESPRNRDRCHPSSVFSGSVSRALRRAKSARNVSNSRKPPSDLHVLRQYVPPVGTPLSPPALSHGCPPTQLLRLRQRLYSEVVHISHYRLPSADKRLQRQPRPSPLYPRDVRSPSQDSEFYPHLKGLRVVLPV